MNIPLIRFIASVAFVLFGIASAPAEAPAKKQGYDRYPMVRTRNIFDPERQPNVPTSAPVSQPAASRADYVALTGIMVTGDKTLAFFSGSRPEFNKVLSINATIAGASITKITPANIEIARDGKSVTVAVGQTVPLDGSAPSAAPASAPTITGPTTAAPGSGTPSAPASDKEALLRRMMERRQQELK